MSVALVCLMSAALPAAPAGLANLDFRTGTLSQWEGSGFTIAPASGRGPSLAAAVCSSDRGPSGRKALLHRTVVVPRGVGAIRFQAAVVRRSGLEPAGALDVVLEASGRRLIPRQIRTTSGWTPSAALLPPARGRLRDYLFPVADLVGQNVRLALIDNDDRPGCHLLCSGFQFIPWEELQGREFAQDMLQLGRKHNLPPMVRLDSKHFMAISNAADEETEHRLYNCETIHALFYEHFRGKGFSVREPGVRMMVAVFDSQAGFEAYLGQAMPVAVTGLYHKPSNRLVVYDYGQNRAFLAAKAQGDKITKQMPYTLARQSVVADFSRQARDRRSDVNVGTIMHEVAHQLSFNGGMLNREGDVPVWLAEGLACYCEATEAGNWQGIGKPNAQRTQALAAQLRAKAGFLPLRALLASDDWLRRATSTPQVILGYAQSWALFRMLIEEHPRALRQYLALIYPRQTPDHRLTDFAQVFGADLAGFEKRYQAYLENLVKVEGRPRK